jgi:hypothetical protein
VTSHDQYSNVVAHKTKGREIVPHVCCNTESINVQNHGSMIVTSGTKIINMLAKKPYGREMFQHV